MAIEKLTEKPIVNIVRVEIVTEEDSPKTYRFDTASEATYAPVVSEGSETILRVKNTILKVTGYNPPSVGAVVNRTKFTTKIYTEEKDGDGETLGYQCFAFEGCKGKPVSFTFKDGEFMAPAYTISSRVKKGIAPYNLAFLEELPS